MRFTLQLTIEAPRDVVWRAFADRSRLANWQATLQSMEPISGVPGERGAVSKMTYREGGRPVVMIETIVARLEEREFACRYAADVSEATIRNTFAEAAAGSTVWTCEVEIAFKGFLRYLTPLLKPVARKKTRADMLRLKELAEREFNAAAAPRS